MEIFRVFTTPAQARPFAVGAKFNPLRQLHNETKYTMLRNNIQCSILTINLTIASVVHPFINILAYVFYNYEFDRLFFFLYLNIYIK